MTFSFTPASSGGWLAFVSGPRLLLVATGADVTAMWAALGNTDGFQGSLDILTSKGLAATPPFVLIESGANGDARVVVRGGTTIQITDASGAQTLSAEGVSTWVERSLSGVTTLSFDVPGATPAGIDSLPLESGVALVAGIFSAGASSSGSAPADTPVPVVAAPPVVEAEEPTPVVDVEETVRELPESATSAPPAVASMESGTPTTESPAVENPAVAATEAPAADGLTGDTVFRDPPAAASESAEPVEPIDDALHDGETVMTSDIAKMRGRRRPNATEAPRPAAAQQLVLVLPTGAREPLIQSILIGRNPSVSKLSGGQIPRLITVGTADQDISRNHAQFALEGGTVVVTDLHSRNGTSIILPGKSPQKLRAGEPTSVIVGTVIDLGGGLTITVEEEPSTVDESR